MMSEKFTKQQITMIVLGLMLSVSGFMGIDVFIPALPAMQHYFHTSAHLMALSIPIYVIAVAVTLLYYGPLSDAIGRKKVFIIGYSIAIVGVFVCLCAHSMPMFLAGRLIMGLGMGASVGLVRALLVDILKGKQLVIYASYISLTMSLVIMLSPLIGGYLTSYGWHAIFLFLLMYYFLAITLFMMFGRETNHNLQIDAINKSKIITNYFTILKSKQFIAYTLASSLALSVNICYITLSAFLLQNHFHLTPMLFSWVTVILAAFSVGGKLINTIVLRYISLKQCIQLGFIIIGSSGVLLCAALMVGHVVLIFLLCCVAMSMMGLGLVFSNATVGATASFKTMRGSVAALFGCCQYILPALCAVIIAPFALHAISAIAIAYVLLAGISLLSLCLLLGTTRGFRKGLV